MSTDNHTRHRRRPGPVSIETTFREGFKAGAVAMMKAVNDGVRPDGLQDWITNVVVPWADASRDWQPGERSMCPRPSGRR